MTAERSETQSVVFVVDDDAAVRDALASLLKSVGLRAEMFASAAQFLEGKRPNAPSCLVLDVRLPGLSGLDFQAELAKKGIQVPIIFITGHGDIPMSVRAMKAGAVEFLTKPVRDQTVAELRANLETLTPREHEVMAYVTAGFMNKQIAGEMGVSEITVKVHRGNVMRKMGARSLANLVRMADVLGIGRTKS